ncbi:hypothetical protein KAF25_010429 [Fusarium avenaceum]|uniref:HpcH/HpaI aldolase/citrate lyase domain-containing protein n=1 Tax=Fusarium avenaceum TaxID=40199 RepID=A0A9P7GR46_9HYPO|nr:hypothetical protein KAF25_010429 [Fusarium avenaceum]
MADHPNQIIATVSNRYFLGPDISTMETFYSNSLETCVASNEVCKAFGIKISPNAQVVQIARNAGFNSLFIDLEHGWLSLAETSNLCNVGLLSGITPFVRVPHQCGNGFIQRVLDGGAMGIIFPHIHNAGKPALICILACRCKTDFTVCFEFNQANASGWKADARAAVAVTKYPPVGCRSMTGQMPIFSMQAKAVSDTMEFCNSSGSKVIAMVESRDAVNLVDKIAAVKGVDVVLVGSMDLTIDMGIGGQWDKPEYREALRQVSEACKAHGKVFGVAGVYDKPKLLDWIINTLGARFLLTQQDISLLLAGGKKTIHELANPR